MERTPVKPGDAIIPRMTADWFNSTLRRPPQSLPGRIVRQVTDYDHILLKLDETGVTKVDWLEPVVLTGAAIDPSTDANDPVKCQVVAKGKKAALGVTITQDSWGIALEPIYAGQVGSVVVCGVTWAKVTRTDSNHKYVTLSTDTYTLKSQSASSPARLLSFAATSGDDGYGLIKLGGSLAGDVKVIVATTDITAASGTTPLTLGYGTAKEVNIYDDAGTIKAEASDNTLTVYNYDDKVIPTGAICRATNCGGFYLVEAIVKNIRVNGLTLQLTYTSEDDVWNTWHTGNDCPAP